MESKYNLPNSLIFILGSIILPHQIERIASEVEINGEKFYVKDEFHTTIISVKKYAPILAEKEKISQEEAEKRIVNIVKKFVKKNPLSFKNYLEDIRIVQEADKKTIVIMCKIKGLEELFDRLNKTLKISIPIPPTHITLYTLANKKPIGINNEDELNNLTTPLKGNDLKKVKLAINY